MTDSTIPTLAQLGWRPFFQQQLSLDKSDNLKLGRIIEQHRNHLVVLNELGQFSVSQSPNDEPVCVGDWVLFDESLKLRRCLERQSLFQRKAPGSKVATQLISANIDSVMIVCSLNQDFNLSRIERYLTLANEAQVEPIIVLTKVDQCCDVDVMRKQVQDLNPLMIVHAINALDPEHLLELATYCQQGRTLALLGSSGVGKSTLVNGLIGSATQSTGDIRENDSKGRHTTTYRALKWLPQGGVLIDTPEMRELQLGASEQGVQETFSEIKDLIQQCRFNNCGHTNEPGCAVQQAIKDESISIRRFNNYQKLMREQARNGSTVAERRKKDKAFSKQIQIDLQEAQRR